jgi:hypothetical protein
MPINIDEDNLKSGLLGLVVTLVEVIQEVLEREALRRMDSGRLKEEEVDRLGMGLMELDEALDRIKRENDIDDMVNKLRLDLDKVVEESIDLITNPEMWEEAKIG